MRADKNSVDLQRGFNCFGSIFAFCICQGHKSINCIFGRKVTLSISKSSLSASFLLILLEVEAIIAHF